jgi:hypothetical protein
MYIILLIVHTSVTMKGEGCHRSYEQDTGVTNKARLPSCLHTIFKALCSPTCVNQCGTFSTSTHYRRKHLESRGFNMRWQEGIISDDLGNVSVDQKRNCNKVK